MISEQNKLYCLTYSKSSRLMSEMSTGDAPHRMSPTSWMSIAVRGPCCVSSFHLLKMAWYCTCDRQHFNCLRHYTSTEQRGPLASSCIKIGLIYVFYTLVAWNSGITSVFRTANFPPALDLADQLPLPRLSKLAVLGLPCK